MLKILTSSQVRDLDGQTIISEPIASIDLMERASLAFVGWFVQKFNSRQHVGVVCGTGNNGGDGLAIARLLHERHYNVKVWIVSGAVKVTEDFNQNKSRLSGLEPIEITAAPDATVFDGINILIDALFGSGLTRPLADVYSSVVERFNQAKATRVAVDIPSGLLADAPSSGTIVKAHHTVTFQLPKLAFLLPESEEYVGEWHIVNIGLSAQHLEQASTNNFYVTDTWVRSRIKPRKKFAHKGDVGRSLLVAGSHGKIGACVLAARSLLRTGAGLLTVHVPACGYEILQTTVPEALVSTDHNEKFISNIDDGAYDAIGIGPGIGTQKETVKAFTKILKVKRPLVVDADGLNILSENKKLLKKLPPHSILTPHPGEFKRLVGKWSDGFERLTLQRELAADTECIVVLKGAHTCVASPDGRAFFNSTGNPAMATGGSGDVLTGMLTSLLAQGYNPLDAALIGVFAHGRAGDLALAKLGGGSIIASDIVDMIPQSFRSFFQ